MNKKKTRLIILLCVFVLLISFLASPLFPYVRSLAVMSIYSHQCEKTSILKNENIVIDIPSNKNWYPFVMTFTADNSFSSYTNSSGTKLTILYNFPAFSLKKGCSTLFDEASPYYSSFYGAYLVQRDEHIPYGFSPDTLELESNAVSSIAEFDFFTLVISDFGLSENDRVFNYNATSNETGISFVGSEGWTRIEADIMINGINHNKKGFVSSYLQYGLPNFPVSSDFAPIGMKSIVYGKYFEEWNTSVFFYVMSPSEAVCKECEKQILSRSTLKNAD